MKQFVPIYSIGHFINQPESSTEFEISRFDEIEEPNVAEIHKHSFYEIIWVEKGTSRQTIDYRDYHVSPKSLFFISPGQIHRFEEWKQLAGGSIMFTEDFFLLNHHNRDKLFELSFLDDFYTDPCIKFNDNDFVDIKKTIDLVLYEHVRNDKSKTIIQACLHILMAQVQRYVEAKNEKLISKRNLVIYKYFKELLDNYFVENKATAFYASQLNITQHHLNFVVKNITGKTATRVIRARSMLEAKRLLTFTDQTVSEVAVNLNYFDNSYFTKLFKKETGTTPSLFKNRISKKYQKE